MAEYFSHDYDSREDEKIIDLMGEHGWAGYGLFWGLIELLYKNGGKMRTQYKRIAFALNSHPDTIEQIVEEFGLFQIKNDFYSSKSVNKRIKERKRKSEVASANAYKRWNKENAIAMQPQCNSNAIKERKVKESKVKESKEDNRPTIEEVQKFISNSDYNIDAKLIYDYYNDMDWHDKNGDKVINWKNKIRNVWFKPENKKPYRPY